jgi:hypothetical protein
VCSISELEKLPSAPIRMERLRTLHCIPFVMNTPGPGGLASGCSGVLRLLMLVAFRRIGLAPTLGYQK